MLKEYKKLKLIKKTGKKSRSIIKVKKLEIGGDKIILIAGPCAIESEKQLDKIAKELSKSGVKLLRGGAYKPRTNPYDFQGLGEKGLKILKKIADKYGMATVTEVMDTKDVELVSKYADILQIGTRNMQNFALLKAVGKTKKPILLKRGMGSTIEEFLSSAEYIMKEGNSNVILCERGIRTFEDNTRNTLSLATVPTVKTLSHLPIIVDPSHSTGEIELITPMSKAAIACGADGLMIEVHTNPKHALSDGYQSILPNEFKKLTEEIKPIIKAVNKTLQ